MPDADPLIVEEISKSYGATQAVERVSLRLERGEVLGLLGENGAGKSTLLRIIAGAESPDAGRVVVGGRELRVGDPLSSAQGGVGTVYQELSLLPALSVAENVFLGEYPTSYGLVRWDAMRHQTRELMARLQIDLDPAARAGDLPLAERYLLELAKAVRRDPSVLILDEPTAALDRADVRRMLELIARLREVGTSIIFVSHRLDEVIAAAQRYLVMRNGRGVGEGALSETSEDALVALMAGTGSHADKPDVQGGRDDDVRLDAAAVGGAHADGAQPEGSEAIRGEALSADGFSRVSLVAQAGEVLGLAGLRGSGRTELCEALVGARPLTRGTIAVRGRQMRTMSPSRALHAGVGYVPAERKTEGLFMNLSVAENIAMPTMARGGRRLARRRGQHAQAQHYASLLAMKLSEGGLRAEVGTLSGGNQQKVVLAKWLAAGVSTLIMDEPTRGVDVVAKSQIYELIGELADAGLCVILSSSELSELTAQCQRIIVLHRGRVTGEVQGPDYDEQHILNLAFGGGQQDGVSPDDGD